MKPRVRSGMRLALEEIELGTAPGDDRRRCQGWKLFALLPRMLLQTCPSRVGSQEQIAGKNLSLFQRGLGAIVDCEP